MIECGVVSSTPTRQFAFIAVKFGIGSPALQTSRVNIGMIADRLNQLHLSWLLAVVANRLSANRPRRDPLAADRSPLWRRFATIATMEREARERRQAPLWPNKTRRYPARSAKNKEGHPEVSCQQARTEKRAL